MATGANSYGTLAQVAALVPRYTTSGDFTGTTRPTRSQVETWIDSVSATLNVSLAGAGFSVPLAQTDAAAACAAVVVEAVADLCHAANTAGRFFTETALERGISPMRAVRREMAEWVDEQADGLELLGAARSRPATAGILYRDTDESGSPTAPIFQRKGFGNSFTDWDGAG